MILEDGKGRGNQAGVDNDNLLEVKSVMVPIASHVSLNKGTDFIWNSSYAATANDYSIYLKNIDQSKKLRISKILLGNTVNGAFNIIKISTDAPAGIVVTPISSNFASSRAASSTSYGNAAVTGISGTTLFKIPTAAYTSSCLNMDGSLILSSNTAIAVQILNTGTIYISICGWFED